MATGTNGLLLKQLGFTGSAVLGLRRAWRAPVLQHATLPCPCDSDQDSRHGQQLSPMVGIWGAALRVAGDAVGDPQGGGPKFAAGVPPASTPSPRRILPPAKPTIATMATRVALYLRLMFGSP